MMEFTIVSPSKAESVGSSNSIFPSLENMPFRAAWADLLRKGTHLTLPRRHP